MYIFFTILLLCLSLSAVADERGTARLQRLSRHYASLGGYVLHFGLKTEGGEQRGEMQVNGNNMYMRIADTEVYLCDSLRYEVNSKSREIVVDRADAYENELLAPLQGLSKIGEEFDIVEQIVEGRVSLRLVPKSQGDVVTILFTADGEAAERIVYGSGEGAVTIEVERAQKRADGVPKFDISRYKGYEMIDFR
ncbi:MAG: hypothetical protein IKA49_04140 [Alistipes sp.]|nr:hypothetical protein [Alistipes sp.]